MSGRIRRWSPVVVTGILAVVATVPAAAVVPDVDQASPAVRASGSCSYYTFSEGFSHVAVLPRRAAASVPCDQPHTAVTVRRFRLASPPATLPPAGPLTEQQYRPYRKYVKSFYAACRAEVNTWVGGARPTRFDSPNAVLERVTEGEVWGRCDAVALAVGTAYSLDLLPESIRDVGDDPAYALCATLGPEQWMPVTCTPSVWRAVTEGNLNATGRRPYPGVDAVNRTVSRICDRDVTGTYRYTYSSSASAWRWGGHYVCYLGPSDSAQP